MHIEERIKSILSTIENPTLYKACHYALFPGGKRLRPKMLLSIAGNAGLDIAVAIEFIHTYTLIHDDLPAMDNDDFRRGKLTLHKAFSESTAILTGDLLLTLAFQVISESGLSCALELIRVISKNIGANHLLQGQLLDLASKGSHIPWETYQTIAIKKTADLFTTALVCGALIKNLPEDQVSIYKEFGQTFGLLYQIKDDIEDKDLSSTHQESNLPLKIRATSLLSKLSTPNIFLAECL